MSGGGSPRQKMINMMYLVLTALLALNVSKEVLDAFVIVSEGLEMQKKNIESKNNMLMDEFENQKNQFAKANPDYYNGKIKPWYDKANEVRGQANDLIQFIQDIKVGIIAEAQKLDAATVIKDSIGARQIDKKDDYDLPTRYMGTDNPPGTNGKAGELKKRLEEFRDGLLNEKYYNPAKKKEDIERIKKAIYPTINTGKQKSIKSGEEVDWEMFYFFHLPIPAALTELTKWQNNVRSVEGEMIKYFLEQVGASSFRFDVVTANVIPKANVVFAGNQFEAEIFLGAYSTQQNPEIFVNGAPLNDIKEGKGYYKVTAQGEGEKKVNGSIKYTNQATGETKEYPFETVYQVSKPMMTVSPDKMNVFYRGLDNPITISVPGVAPNQIQANCNGCQTFTGGNGKYVVKPGQGNKCTISVSVKLADKVQKMGDAEFRIKRIPDPTIKFSGKKSNESLTIVEATSGGSIIPMLEDFDFDVYAKIAGFAVSFDPGTGSIYDKTCSGNIIPADVTAMMKKIPKGKKIYFDNIKITMPDGTTRTSNAVYQIR